MAKDKNITLPPDFFPAEKSYGSSLQMNPHLSGNVDYDLIERKRKKYTRKSLHIAAKFIRTRN